MAIGANSYGDPDEIASLVRKHANASVQFDASTKPSLGRVEGYCDQISAILNSYLAAEGFVIPVSQADAVLALDSFVNEAVAEIVEGINGYGRFGPTRDRGGGTRWRGAVTKEGAAFIKSVAVGFERMGATREHDPASSIGAKTIDGKGDEAFPIFGRRSFGNRFINWEDD